MALAMLACIALGACHRTPDEQQVRQAIAAAATAARGNDADGVLDAVSEDFVGNDGDLDRRGLKQMLAVRAFRHDSTGVLIGPISVERRGDRLIATFTLTLTGGRPDSLLPDHADVHEMTTAWRREGRYWRCYSAHWRQPL
ncbi:MAG: hypothetical protein ACREPP_02800 [Rhodanobacteraceae bacterium]